MPAKELKALRQEGKLDEALNLAKAELEAQPDSIWPKRNISWVFYEYVKLNSSAEQFDAFISWLEEIQNLQLNSEEKLLFDQLAWQIGKMAFSLSKSNPVDIQNCTRLFEVIKSFHFTRPSEAYSFLFKGLHKAMKETSIYLEFAEWWDFKNLMPKDFQYENLPNGKEIMSVAEQAYINYAKHLLTEESQHSQGISQKEKIESFLPSLSEVAEKHPQFLYPAYYEAKLLLALGDKENMIEKLLPFAKKKRNDFWVWEVFAEAFSNDSDKVFACYCKALSCRSPEEMLVNLRQKMAGLLVYRKLYNEAKTEIGLLAESRTRNGYNIPGEVINWQTQAWYKQATASRNNLSFYKEYIPSAEALLFTDIPEESVIVDFVNTNKKMLNFIASESKFGFFKYDRFLNDVSIGDTLKVRFQGGSNEGMHQVYTAIKVNDEDLKKQFLKDVSGKIRIPEGKPFGFIEGVFIHPSLIRKLDLTDGLEFTGTAIKSYNKDKKTWGWKLT